jgi:ResB-like family protein
VSAESETPEGEIPEGDAKPAEAAPSEGASEAEESSSDAQPEDEAAPPEEAAPEADAADEAPEDTPAEDAPAEEAPAAEAPAADTTAEEAPAADAPAEEAPAADAPAEEAPAADAPAEEAPAADAPAEEAPVGGKVQPSKQKEPVGPLGHLVAFFGSYGLSVTVLLFLFLLTYLGTIEQTQSSLYEVQKRYFESIFLIHEAHVFGLKLPVPLPGVKLLLGLLTINLVVGGLIRIRKSRRTGGVIVIHIGMLLLIVAGFVKLQFADDGHLTLYEGTESTDFVSYHEWEVAIWEADKTKDVRELLIPDAQITRVTGERKTTFSHPELPFKLLLSGYVPNAMVKPKGPQWEAASPVVDGFAILRRDPEKEHEANAAAIYCEVLVDGKKTPGLLWGGFSTLQPPPPLVIQAGGKRWAIDLRRRRFAMPFKIRLDDFVHEYHPGTSMAKFFKSHVTKIEGGTSSKVLIQMNEPLRHNGLVIFQSSWGPPNAPPGSKLFSGFSVVRNPSDQWPLYACIVISIGLLWAFGEKLLAYVKSQAPKRRSDA